METIERQPLKPWDGKPLSPWKDNTELRRGLLRTAAIVPALLAAERAFGDEEVTVYFSAQWSWEKPYLRIVCPDEVQARRVVGKMIRVLGQKPVTKKVSDDELQAVFSLGAADTFDEAEIIVAGYKPKTCRYEEVEVDVPATPERTETKVVLAQPARKEKRRIIVCDDAQPEPQNAGEVAAAAAQDEVPF